MLVSACIGQDPCEKITCGKVCRGDELWEQSCVNGECVDQEMIEKNSEKWEAEDYEVYNALIVNGLDLIANWGKSLNEMELIVIVDHTGTDCESDAELKETLQYVSEQMPSLDSETIYNFRSKNAQSYFLDCYFDLPVKVVLLSDDVMREIFDDDGWKEFYERYASAEGIMRISRVGFNSTKDQALVYVGSNCDYLYGVGYYVLFIKENGVWMIQDEVCTWIS